MRNVDVSNLSLRPRPLQASSKPRRDRCRKCGGKLKEKLCTVIDGLGPVTELFCPKCERPMPPPRPQPQPKPRRKSARAKTRPAYDPQIGAEIYRLLVGWRQLTPEQLDERIRQVRRLAAKCHLGEAVWRVIDKMHARLRTGVHARSADVA